MLYNIEHMENETPQVSTSLQTGRLIEVLETLETHIKRQNSLKYALLKGMMYGLGTVIGATVLVALFGGIIATTINSFTEEPIVSKTLRQ
ncbi:MAG: type II secretory pathway component PulF [Candidatus Paceibacteria bacterium]